MAAKKLPVVLLIALNFLFVNQCVKAQYKVLHSFDGIGGAFPYGALTLDGSKLYGMTQNGGQDSVGCIFCIDTNGNNFRDIFNFTGTNGAYPFMGALVINGTKMYGMTSEGGVYDSGCVFSIDTNGKGYEDLLDFNGKNGVYPQSAVVMLGNKLYGMAYLGGAYEYGCIFSIDTGGREYKDLHDFNGMDGANPYGQVTIIGKKFYGMTDDGGANYWGNIFSIDTNGKGYSDLFDFNGANGGNPNNILTPSDSGNVLFGMCDYGYTNLWGNVFSIDTGGTNFNQLVIFDSTDGAFPDGDVILKGNVLYGMTSEGGGHDSGRIFSVNTNGSNYMDLHDFDGPDGSTPFSNLTNSGTKLFGTTAQGGAHTYGVIFSLTDRSAGINEVKSQAAVSLYPNPNNGMFTIQWSMVSGQSGMLSGAETSVEIYNMLGEEVYCSAPALPPPGGGGVSVSYNSTISYKLNLSSQPNGIYLYRVLSENGALIGEGKMIIQK